MWSSGLQHPRREMFSPNQLLILYFPYRSRKPTPSDTYLAREAGSAMQDSAGQRPKTTVPNPGDNLQSWHPQATQATILGSVLWG